MNAVPHRGEAQAVPQGDGTLAVRGALTFETVPDVLRATAERVRRSNSPLTIDLKDVQRVDSAGLALLLEWLNLAPGRAVRFVNVPPQARSLIRVSGLGAALGIENHD